MANLILRLANSPTTAQFQEYLPQLIKAEELQNQAFSIKGGAAVVGDNYYILMGGERNRLLDSQMNIEWIGKKNSEYEIIFYNQQRSSVVPKSIDDVKSLWIFIYAQERVYFINMRLASFGYYQRK